MIDLTAYASPFERLIARIIDKVVITLPVFLWFGPQGNQKTVETIGGAIMLVAIVLLNVIWDGQTVGKHLMKIRIQSNSGSKLNFFHYLLREFLFTLFPIYLITQPLVQVCWLFWMLTTMALILMYGRGIHDHLVKTVVIRTVPRSIKNTTQNLAQ